MNFVEWQRGMIPDTVLDDLSPFREERTPSFFVNDRKGFYHDFGSGAHGDIFEFLMKVEGLDFPQAVKRCEDMVGGADFNAASPAPSPSRGEEQALQLRKARWLWSRRAPIIGSIAETYLRARGYDGLLPATLGYLPPEGEHAPALIAAYGIAIEPEPGMVAVTDDAVFGVHLIKLRPDGSDRLRDDPKCKFTIGKGFVAPILLAPANDLMGMVIAEGIEDALNAHEASGLGAWAAGTATRLPALAGLIPSYIECVTILVDDDEAGRSNSHKLMVRLRDRKIEVRLTSRGSFS